MNTLQVLSKASLYCTGCRMRYFLLRSSCSSYKISFCSTKTLPFLCNCSFVVMWIISSMVSLMPSLFEADILGIPHSTFCYDWNISILLENYCLTLPVSHMPCLIAIIRHSKECRFGLLRDGYSESRAQGLRVRSVVTCLLCEHKA